MTGFNPVCTVPPASSRLWGRPSFAVDPEPACVMGLTRSRRVFPSSAVRRTRDANAELTSSIPSLTLSGSRVELEASVRRAVPSAMATLFLSPLSFAPMTALNSCIHNYYFLGQNASFFN